MALARYSDQFWFPSGALAANVEARVFPEGSSAFAALFTDASGATPLANPTATDGTGTLTFWAESGTYWVHLDTESFLVTVGMSQEQADLSTGVASGGQISVNALDPSAVDITACDGYIVDYTADDQAEPVITRVKTVDQTVSMDAAALARAITWWLLDSAGNVVQQAAKPGPIQQRTHILLGITGHTGGVIGVAETIPVILPGTGNQLVDLMDALGPFSISGNIISANGTNLMINQSGGTMFARAFAHYTAGAFTQHPHLATTAVQTPATFIQVGQSTTVAPPLTQTVDVGNYDNAGVITPVPGGANQSTILRVFLFAATGTPFQLIIQYGQATYNSLAAAVNAIGAEPFTTNTAFVEGNGTLIAYIAVIHSATDLSDPAQAVFVKAGKFATP